MESHASETTQSREQNGPSGVGGWLGLLVWGMILGPLLSIGGNNYSFSHFENLNPHLLNWSPWASFKILTWIAILFFWGISAFGGLQLLTKKTPVAVRIAKVVLWFNFPIYILVTSIFIPLVTLGEFGGQIAGEAVPDFISSFLFLFAFTFYLKKSKRVKNTYFFDKNQGMKENEIIPVEGLTGDPIDQIMRIEQEESGGHVLEGSGINPTIYWVLGITAVMLLGVAATMLVSGLSRTRPPNIQPAVYNQVATGGENSQVLIVVAATDIEFGDPLDTSNLAIAKWPSANVPNGSFRKIDDVIGRIATSKIYAGQPLLAVELADNLGAPPDMARLIRKGFRAVDIPIKYSPTMPRPSNELDVVEISGNRALPFLEKIRVLAVAVERTSGKAALTLEVPSHQAGKFLELSRQGDIELILRNPEDPSSKN
jgi:Flp pilus assembly protein CpaB